MSFLRTGGHRRPDALAPLLSRKPSGALGDASVDHTESKRAFGDVVGRINLGMGDEGKVFLAVFSKAFSQHSGLSARLCSFGHV